MLADHPEMGGFEYVEVCVIDVSSGLVVSASANLAYMSGCETISTYLPLASRPAEFLRAGA